MRIRLSFLLLGLMGGCLSTSPLIPERYHLSPPNALAEFNSNTVVLIGASAYEKRAADGNVYGITWLAMTNTNSELTDHPDVIAANAILATNTWPKFRQHLELSLDGGATWPHRIGYGIQTPRGSVGGEFIWSPPEDYSLLTDRAMLRLVDLDGLPFRGPTNGLPCDTPSNGIRSAVFAIVGAVIDTPEPGTTLYRDTPATVTFRQVSDNSDFDLYWVTPDASGFFQTFTNCVMGSNTRSIYIPADFPLAAEMSFCVRGVQYPSIVGYSAPFTVSP